MMMSRLNSRYCEVHCANDRRLLKDVWQGIKRRNPNKCNADLRVRQKVGKIKIVTVKKQNKIKTNN